jgi:hypothetical protein
MTMTTGKRAGASLLALGLAGSALAVAAPAAADEHDPQFPEHAHVLLLQASLEFTDQGPLIEYRKCVDLAANKALPLHVHHRQLHFGRAGQALRQAGNVIVPMSPFPSAQSPLPFSDCASLANVYPPRAG